MIAFFKKCILLGVVCGCAAMLAGYLGFLHPAFDTFSHFRMHGAACLALAFFVLIFTRHRIIASLALAVAVAGFLTSQVAYPWSAVTKQAVAERPVYRLLHLNLLWNHLSPASVVDELLALDPDILSLAESSRIWIPHLSRLNERWPHLHNCPENGPRGGVRIYSKWPMDTSEVYCGVYGTFGTVAVTLPGQKPLTIGSVHLRWPWPASGPEQLESFIPTLQSLDENALVAGDFNATTWSYTTKRFAKAGGLEVVAGVGPTWLFEEFPADFAYYFGLPIDHAMAKGRVQVLQAKRLPSLGSDHFPIMVSFQINP